MKSIGFRASPNEVYYAIAENSQDQIKLISLEKIRVPISQPVPEQLNFLRRTIKDIINEFKVTAAGIRTTEQTSQNWSIERISIEGVIQELFCSSTVENYFIGQIATIAAKLGIDRGDFKLIVEKKTINSCCGVVLDGYNKDKREAILVAIAALKM